MFHIFPIFPLSSLRSNLTRPVTPSACAGVCRGAGLIGASKAPSGDDGAVGTETMDGAILHAPVGWLGG